MKIKLKDDSWKIKELHDNGYFDNRTTFPVEFCYELFKDGIGIKIDCEIIKINQDSIIVEVNRKQLKELIVDKLFEQKLVGTSIHIEGEDEEPDEDGNFTFGTLAFVDFED